MKNILNLLLLGTILSVSSGCRELEKSVATIQFQVDQEQSSYELVLFENSTPNNPRHGLAVIATFDAWVASLQELGNSLVQLDAYLAQLDPRQLQKAQIELKRLKIPLANIFARTDSATLLTPTWLQVQTQEHSTGYKEEFSKLREFAKKWLTLQGIPSEPNFQFTFVVDEALLDTRTACGEIISTMLAKHFDPTCAPLFAKQCGPQHDMTCVQNAVQNFFNTADACFVDNLEMNGNTPIRRQLLKTLNATQTELNLSECKSPTPVYR